MNESCCSKANEGKCAAEGLAGKKENHKSMKRTCECRTMLVGGVGGGGEMFLTQVENLPNETGTKGGATE